MTQTGPGRPRLTRQRRPGPTAAAEILDAAAELFTTHGFSTTSTRRIADAVGVRQASLYHHFATKDDILVALLEGTVTGALDFADRLVAGTEPPPVRLYALLLFDAGQLLSSRWNLGALYLLPELRTDRYADFRAERRTLRDRYAHLAGLVLDDLGVRDRQRRGLPFRIVETAINERSDADSGDTEGGDTGTPVTPATIADAGLRVLGWFDVDPLREPAGRLVAEGATDAR